MGSLTDFMIQYSYWGMFLAAFLAGSIVPFSSETVMLALWALGFDPLQLIIYGSIGNVLGSMFNYGLGRMGKLSWLERWFHVKEENLEKAKRFMGGRGAFMGFFCFIPILGSAIAVVLGLTRANIFISVFSIALGKILRYVILIYGLDIIF
jgi:membrane protein YqaA with SNARE-associated domain